MKSLRVSISVMAWVSAVILALLPIVVAADFGGVLWWTQSIAAITILVAAGLAIPSVLWDGNVRFLRQHYLVLILFVWWAYSWLQTVPMFGGLVGTLSRGTGLAYRDWIKPYMGDEGAPTFYPISIDPEQSAHAVAMLAIVLCIVWTATQVFVSRPKIGMLLNVLAIGAALHAAFGIVRQVYPEVQVFGVTMAPNSFGSFVNRNNAALMMNLGLGASLGLLAWRLAALTGLEVDDPNFEFNDILSLSSDRNSLIGLVSATLCLCGLLVCGSRGGLVALVIGSLLALGWVRSKRGTKTIPVVCAAVVVCAAFLLVPLNLDLQSIQRFELFDSDNTTTLLSDGRLPHWRSSLQAAKAHFPAGSGLGSYAYAYLPYQTTGSDKWFHHADNLWLEMLVEQGIVGLVLTFAVLFLWIRTLLRMTHSVDPIDHGLRVAGWFILGAVVTSQIFDFGLIVPANLFAIAVYIPATLARASAAGLDAAKNEREIFPSKYAGLLTSGLAAVAVLLAVFAGFRLRSDADVDALARHASAVLPGVDRDADALTDLETQLRQSPRLEQSPVLLDLLAKVENAQARLIETAEARPASVAAAQKAYDQTAIITRRKHWYLSQRQSSNQGESNAAADFRVPELAAQRYQSILDLSRKSLRRLPLGMESRTWQLYLDYVHGNKDQSDTAIVQLSKMYTGNSAILQTLGALAATSGDAELATLLWRRSLELNPKRAVSLLGEIESTPGVDLLAVLPSNPDVFRSVTRKLINTGGASRELLERAGTEIDCENCESKKEMSKCRELAGEIATQLGEVDKSIDQLRMAIDLDPTNMKYHLVFMQRLRTHDRRQDALVAARRARLLFPDDNRFGRFIDDMANEDRKGLENVEGVPEDSGLFQPRPGN